MAFRLLVPARRCLALAAGASLALGMLAAPSFAASRSHSGSSPEGSPESSPGGRGQLIATAPGAVTYRESLPGGVTAYFGVARAGSPLLGLPSSLDAAASTAATASSATPSNTPSVDTQTTVSLPGHMC